MPISTDTCNTAVVYDNHTGQLVSTHKTMKSARASAERRDLEYGAARYSAMTTDSYARMQVAR